MSVADHGYGRYGLGCRCATCRAAKATYMRDKRRTARAGAGIKGRYDITHGYAGYVEMACRCLVCRAANAVSKRRRKARLAVGGAS